MNFPLSRLGKQQALKYFEDSGGCGLCGNQFA